jgi:RNA polymerase sigma-70 factor (ECF subfamily)
VLARYDQLSRLEVHCPAAGLRLTDGLNLDNYYLFHAIRGDLLARLGRMAEARKSFDAPARLTGISENTITFSRDFPHAATVSS